jgi:hypothetical protein
MDTEEDIIRINNPKFIHSLIKVNKKGFIICRCENDLFIGELFAGQKSMRNIQSKTRKSSAGTSRGEEGSMFFNME